MTDDLPEGVDLTALECRHGCTPPTDVHPDCELHATDEPFIQRYRRATCPECNGRGYQLVAQMLWGDERRGVRHEVECEACEGTGWRGGVIPDWVYDVPESLRRRLGWHS